MAVNPRLSFINKEKDFESSLGDFGVRKYEDGLGRFTTCDPLFEKYYGWSPYVYSGNNPVNLYDNNGKWWENHHGLLVESAAKGNGLSRSQLQQLVRGTMQVDKRQKPEEQYLHCMLSANDVKELGYVGALEKTMLNAKIFFTDNINNFLSDDSDKAFYYLGQALHVIADSYCLEHNWDIWTETPGNKIKHTVSEILQGLNETQDWKDAKGDINQFIKYILKKKRENRGYGIGNQSENPFTNWFLGPSMFF